MGHRRPGRLGVGRWLLVATGKSPAADIRHRPLIRRHGCRTRRPCRSAPRPLQPDAAPMSSAREPAPVPAKKDRAAVADAGPDGSRAPAAAKPPAPSSPRQICGDPDRAWLSRLNCMRVTCGTPKWERHPHCADWQLWRSPGDPNSPAWELALASTSDRRAPRRSKGCASRTATAASRAAGCTVCWSSKSRA